MKAKLLSLALLLTVTASYADLDCEQEPYKSNPDFQKTCQELLESIQDAKKENLQRFSKQIEEKRGLVKPRPVTNNPTAPAANSNQVQTAPAAPPATTYTQPAPAPEESTVAPPAAPAAPAKPTNRIYY